MSGSTTPVVPVSPPRRTQQQRREATIARLLDAAIESILRVGYARTSLAEICERAGVSKGGLFRHFDSRLDLIVSAADEVADRHLAAFRERLRDRDSLGPREALSIMRDRHRDDVNVVWFELLVAARTDDELRKRLAPVTRRFHAAIDDAARAVPELAALSDADRHLVVSFTRNHFDGETITGAVAPEPEVDDARFELLLRLAVATPRPR